MKNVFSTKWASTGITVAAVVIAGSIATASAHSGSNRGDDNGGSGYTKDQCKDGGWKTFQNSDGSQKFKNQGQCVSFFADGGKGKGHDNDNDNHHKDNHKDSKGHHSRWEDFKSFCGHFFGRH